MGGSGHGIKFEAPLSQEKDILWGLAFVYVNVIVEGYLTRTEITIEDIYISMQKYINRREGEIKSTGGSIILDKSLVYHISFKWDDQGD